MLHLPSIIAVIQNEKLEIKMVQVNKKRTIFPAAPSEVQQIKLSCSDLAMVFAHYIQKGLLYQTPADDFPSYVEGLVERLSEVLVKFYPLAGRLTTSPLDGGIYILCNDSGVEFIEATAKDVSIADLTTAEVTPAVEELFALHGAVNFEGHRLPLLVIQVTQLKDGVAVCCTLNHAIADGASLWDFFNFWSRLCKTNRNKIPDSPIYDRSLLEPPGSAVRLGLDPDGHVPQICPPPLPVKIFHFSAHTISRLKEQANQDSSFTISSFQAFCGHVWRAVTRARRLCPDETV
ncbi:hypothetical protein SUGI_0863340 [Cryptomeria japonica]|nr:hypothetical protein SUGI_0863340 [Cryptomeria japonica]